MKQSRAFQPNLKRILGTHCIAKRVGLDRIRDGENDRWSLDLFDRGMDLKAEGLNDMAQEHFKQALQFNPNDARIYFVQASNFYDLVTTFNTINFYAK